MAVGRYRVNSQKLAKVAIAKSNTVTIEIGDIAGETVVKVDNMAQSLGIGFDGAGTVTSNSVNDEINAREWHGVTYGMNVSINTNPRYFDIAPGIYYISGYRYIYPGATIDTVSIPGGSFASAIMNYDGSITLLPNSFPTSVHLNDGFLEITAFSKTDSNNINKIGNSFFESFDFVKKVYIRNKLFDGTRFQKDSGKISTNGLNVNITGGKINTSNMDVKEILADTTIVGQEIYRVAGQYTIFPETTITLKNSEYDNGNLVTLTDNKYVVHTIARSSRTDSIYVVVGDTEHNKAEEAIEADYNLGIFEGIEGGEIEPLANVVIEKGAISAFAIIDLRGGEKVTTSSLASIFDTRVTALETKLSGIDDNANNYTHPASHAISLIDGLQAIIDDYEARISALETP